MKNYRSIIYKEIEDKRALEQFISDEKIEINIHPMKAKNETVVTTSNTTASQHRARENTEPADTGKGVSQSRFSALKESKVSTNKRQANSGTKERSVSRKKGISLCSK